MGMSGNLSTSLEVFSLQPKAWFVMEYECGFVFDCEKKPKEVILLAMLNARDYPVFVYD